MAFDIPKLIPDMDWDLADFRELKRLARLWEVDLAKPFNELIDAGTPTIRGYVDATEAIKTGNVVVHYHLANELLVLLATMRARELKELGVP